MAWPAKIFFESSKLFYYKHCTELFVIGFFLVLEECVFIILGGHDSMSNCIVFYFCHYYNHTDTTHRQKKYLHSIIMARRYSTVGQDGLWGKMDSSNSKSA